VITAAVNTNVKLKQLKVCAPMRPLYLKLQIEINRKHTHTHSFSHAHTHTRTQSCECKKYEWQTIFGKVENRKYIDTFRFSLGINIKMGRLRTDPTLHKNRRHLENLKISTRVKNVSLLLFIVVQLQSYKFELFRKA
jgi:hypothetical protein